MNIIQNEQLYLNITNIIHLNICSNIRLSFYFKHVLFVLFYVVFMLFARQCYQIVP